MLQRYGLSPSSGIEVDKPSLLYATVKHNIDVGCCFLFLMYGCGGSEGG